MSVVVMPSSEALCHEHPAKCLVSDSHLPIPMLTKERICSVKLASRAWVRPPPAQQVHAVLLQTVVRVAQLPEVRGTAPRGPATRPLAPCTLLRSKYLHQSSA